MAYLRWRGMGVLIFVLLLGVACGNDGGNVSEEAVTETAVSTVVATRQDDDDGDETERDEASNNGATMEINGMTVFTDDNRSNRLQALTSSWETNWNKRTIDYSEILSGGPPRDGIPSVDEPKFESIDEAAVWLVDNEPVIVVELDDEARAYPLSILTRHEIVNDELAGEPILITFCPLCNSAIVFERTLDGEVYEFGTSGLLRNSDLIMYDRTTESLWQQFTGQAIVGDMVGQSLTFLPSSLVGFGNFKEAHPDGEVLSRDTGIYAESSYGNNPYPFYDTLGQRPFLFDGEIDGRLDPMMRVVSIDFGDRAVAYPWDRLSDQGVINDRQGEHDIVLFHVDGTSSALADALIAFADDVGATGAFEPFVDGEKLTFAVVDGKIVDEETGSEWNVLGQAVAGELAGSELTPIIHGDHFWFSWAAFFPETAVYGEGEAMGNGGAGEADEVVEADEADEGTDTAFVEDLTLADTVMVPEGGYGFQPLVKYTLNRVGELTYMSVEGNPDGPQFLMTGTTLAEGDTIEDILEGIVGDVTQDPSTRIVERREVEINGVAGQVVSFEGADVSGQIGHAQVAVLGNEMQGYMLFVGASAADWPMVQAEFDTVLATVVLFPPVEAAPPPPAP
ncbi:MAG TPA: DUF3179 domain-containing protein [Anaerolineae bacterium]|nr:DUF3179 domain-containing protein [Anaerolineae bacterium]